MVGPNYFSIKSLADHLAILLPIKRILIKFGAWQNAHGVL
jgi:hypothetical protein